MHLKKIVSKAIYQGVPTDPELSKAFTKTAWANYKIITTSDDRDAVDLAFKSIGELTPTLGRVVAWMSQSVHSCLSLALNMVVL